MSRTSLQRLANFAGFQLGWFACVLGAAHGRAWLGPLVALALLSLQLALLTPAPRRAAELRFWLLALPLAVLLDGQVQAAGLVRYAGAEPGAWLPPAWIAALWPLFAATFSSSLAWLSRRYLLGALLGLVASPLSYLGGARLGALELHTHSALLVYGLSWALAVPLLQWIHARLLEPRAPPGGTARA